MHTDWQRMSLVITLMLLLGSWGGMPGALARAATLDPSLTDVLNGRRHLLRTDDVVYTLTFATPPTGDFVQVMPQTGVIPTANSAFPGGGSLFTPLEDDGGNPTEEAIGASTATAVGRMFNRPYDVIAMVGTLPSATTPQFFLNVLDPPTNSWLPAVLLPLPVAQITVDFANAPNFTFAVMADFTGDGYADLLLSSTDNDGNSGLVIFTAADVNDMTAALTMGPVLTLPSGAWYSGVTVGDFDGDGQPEIAALAGNSGQSVDFLAVDPKTLQITRGTSLTLPSAVGVGPSALAAGRFRDTTHDDVIVVGDIGNGPDTNALTAYGISLDNPQQPQVKSTTPLSTSKAGTVLAVKARSGRLDWSGAVDQLVIGAVTEEQGTVTIGAFDQDLNLTTYGPTTVTESKGCLYDLTLGNFDRQNSDGTRNFNLQIATLWAVGQSCDGYPRQNSLAQPLNVLLWSVDPTSQFAMSPTAATLIEPVDPSSGSDVEARVVAFSFAAGDTQGRSVLLGLPERVSITSVLQPELVLGIPPMHIDYIRDKDNLGPEGKPAVLNLTVMPSLPAPAVGFSTQFDFGSSATGSASRKTTTSWGLATKFTNDEKASFGVPDVASVSVEAKTSVGFAHDSTVATQYNTYASTSDSLTATTGFADHLFFTAYSQNIFYYPVIGHTVCPAGQADCPDSARLPLYVQFSVPDTPSHLDIDATTQAWYQPVHEPGNLFSYPWDETQLQLALPSTWVPLTNSGNAAPWRGTDTSTSSYANAWAVSSGTTQSSGSVNAQSFSLSICTSGSVGVSGLGARFSNTYDLNQSFSVSSLNTSTQTLAASQGIKADKPDFGDVVADTYLYEFAGYVFGLQSPAESLQSIDLEDASQNPIDIQSTGPMLVGYLADPFREVSPPWWLQAYALPDVGLNHPSRWDWSKSQQLATFNCADGTSRLTCTTDTSDDPLLADFYRMKGFFITPADANGHGPNRSVATAGDQLTLTVRVYNYSLKDTNDPSLSHPAAAIRVRFYGQVFDNGQLQGASFPIGETTIGFITGFKSVNTGPGGANWTVASVPFDTGGDNCGGQSCAAKSLVFWVVVWMEDGNGDLVPEIEGHGLRANPGAMTLAQITDVPIEAYSNNVGLYGMDAQFSILPAANTLDASLPATASAPGSLTIEDLSVPAQSLLLDHKVRLTARVRSDETRAGPVLVAYYDGDPLHGGKVFDVHHISHLAPNDTYHTKAEYRPQTCGAHTLVVVADPASGTPATARTSVQVRIVPADLVEALMRSTAGLDLPSAVEVQLLMPLRAAKHAFQRHFERVGANRLKAFIGEVEAQRGVTLTAQQADRLIAQAKVILGCV